MTVAARVDVSAAPWRPRRSTALGVLAAALVASALLAACVGAMRVSPAAVLGSALEAAGLGAWNVDPRAAAVVISLRLPRVALGALVGAALGTAGASLQGTLRNPLADPGLLGISSGAAFAAAFAIVLGAGVLALSAAAFAGALVAALVMWRLGSVEGETSVPLLLLAGIAVNALCGALTGAVVYGASDAQLRSITFWSFGSLGGATPSALAVIAPLITVAVVALLASAPALDALALGEAEAAHLGVDVESLKRRVVLAVALAVGTSVASSGVIGFVGLVVPHVARIALGPGHRGVMPASAMLGATLLVLADAVARTVVAPAELPVGVVSACVGGPFFLGLLLRRRRALAS